MNVSNSDIVKFTRRGIPVKGKVIDIRTETVMVEINAQDALLLGYENCMTVVNHKNYKVIPN